jgi:hypothetical protein
MPQKSKKIGLSERTDADKNLFTFFPWERSAGVSPAHFLALQQFSPITTQAAATLGLI